MTSFSQNAEDEIFVPLLPAVGKMMEIGAYDPVALSNSRALIQAGWEAVLVEANPNCLKKIIDFYRTEEPNQNVTIVNALVESHDPSIIPFQVCWDAVSTTNQRYYDTWKNTAKFFEIHMITTPIAWLFSKFPGPYDFISVDVEGSSFALAMYVFDVVKPTVACVEHEGSDIDRMVEFAKSRGYKAIAATSENIIFSKE
jgi:hypothetical protein